MATEQFPIRHVRNIRDLLTVAMAPELERYMVAEVNPESPTAGQQIVAFVLDHITPYSYELLAKLQAKQEGTDIKQHSRFTAGK